MKPKLRTFEHFPTQKTCPVCHTSDDEICVLVAIDGTEDDGNVEAVAVHLACAVATNYRPGMIYRLFEEVGI